MLKNAAIFGRFEKLQVIRIRCVRTFTNLMLVRSFVYVRVVVTVTILARSYPIHRVIRIAKFPLLASQINKIDMITYPHATSHITLCGLKRNPSVVALCDDSIKYRTKYFVINYNIVLCSVHFFASKEFSERIASTARQQQQ